MSDEFRLLMLGAMYENGGNTTHRLLDGHPQLHVYPFESQLGTRLVEDQLGSVFPLKYRWPTFDLAATPEQDYRAIVDEEGKVRARTPHVSKFRGYPFDLDDDDRMARYAEIVRASGRSRGGNVMAFFESTFAAWKDCRRSGRESVYVGYSPILVVDADKVLDDLPQAHFLHVVRNPWSAYADTKKRPVPLSLDGYMLGWTLNQHYALLHAERYPERMHVLRTEDIMADPERTLGDLCERIGLERSPTLAQPSWNGGGLDQVYPWGTIRTPTPEANLATALELSPEERADVREHAWQYLEVFGYDAFLDQLEERWPRAVSS
ncbi:sulfotransferase [Conexibacter sp. JD483]|uniref:sulfotransferase n=1 Tax=unclassified Conexibacter TaxID=2627773 RepID=UPI00271FEDA8|nr:MULTISPECIES: sulfotransferase [unclassified Conexibacter]MDO8184192.1 sulfotransferase [Conexibacter sp. CPCC 205706]MDO8197184.1 sulfotransferase [Conexibacter sp. CPCC 205762]MDR9367501.1 sulfotransferase [Conexibacter sp. JD483]